MRFAVLAAVLVLLWPGGAALAQLVTIGDLPPGKTVTVTFRTTVANLSNGLAPAAVTNQGTVTGTNFADVPTDDPATGTAGDATVTPFDSLTVSDRVWEDLNGNGLFDGTPTDAGLDGVDLSLFVDVNGNNLLDVGDGPAIAFATTAAGGFYGIGGLLPGAYLVRLDPANFGGGGAVQGYVSYANIAADPDNDVNNDDNGIDEAAPAVNGIASLAITLTHDGETLPDGTGKLDVNDSLDFGLVQLADIEVTKSAPATVVAGSGAMNLTHVVTVRNNGPSGASGLEISEVITLPAGVTIDSITPSAGSYAPPAAATGTWTVGTLASGNFETLTIVYTVASSAAAGDIVSDTATVSAVAQSDPDPGNDQDTAATTIERQVDLEVTKTESVDPVIAGDGDPGNLTYFVTVTNNGPSDATGVELSEDLTLPAGVTVDSITPSGSGSFATTTAPDGTWTVGDLAAGAVETLTVVLSVGPSVAPGIDVIGDEATVTAVTESLVSPDTTPDSAAETTSVATEADLAVAKSDDVDPVTPGGTLIYTVTVTNNGPSDAQNVVVTETLPADVSFVATVGCAEDPAGVPTCSLGAIADGGATQYTVEVTVDDPVPAGLDALTNQVDVASDTTDPIAANDSVTEDTAVDAAPDLAITKDDGGITATPGSVIAYTLDFENSGDQGASNVKIVDEVPADTTFNEAASGGAGVWKLSPGGVLDCPDGAPAGTVCEHQVASLGGAAPVSGIVGVAGRTGARTTNSGGKGAAGSSGPASLAAGTVTFAVTVDPGVDLSLVTQIDNTATIEDDGANGFDPPANNTSSDSTPLAGDADLEIGLTQSNDKPAGGSVQLYVAAVANNGPDPARDVVATVQLPVQSAYLGITGDPGTTCTVDGSNLVTCDLGNMSASETKTTTIGARIDPRAEGAKLVESDVTGTVASDPVPGNESSDVVTEIVQIEQMAAVEFTEGSTTRHVLGITLDEGDESLTLGAYDAPTGTRLGIHVSLPGFRPVDIAGIDDVSGVTGSGNTADDFAVLSDSFEVPLGALTVSVIDADTQDEEGVTGLIVGGGLNGDTLPIGLEPLPSFDGTPAAELAVLIRNGASGRPQVWVWDSGGLFSLAFFNVLTDESLFPLFIQSVPDFSGNLVPEIAVAVRDTDADDTRVIVRDATGTFLGSHSFGPGLFPLGLAGPVDGAGLAPELALLVRDTTTGALEARVFDPATGAVSATKVFDPAMVPGTIEAIENFGDLPTGELAVLGRSGAELKVEIRDADPSGALVSTFPVAMPPATLVPQDMAVVPDFIDTVAAELAILSTAFGGDSRVDEVDALSGTPPFTTFLLP